MLISYFDPGAGSLILQLLVGGSAGFLIFLKYVFKRFIK
jgi:hypothetical protein